MVRARSFFRARIRSYFPLIALTTLAASWVAHSPGEAAHLCAGKAQQGSPCLAQVDAAVAPTPESPRWCSGAPTLLEAPKRFRLGARQFLFRSGLSPPSAQR